MKEEDLKNDGYGEVYVWDAVPSETDLDHTHDFDVKLVILEGEIEIGIDGRKMVLKEGATIEIPRNKVHSGLAGPLGCKYLVGERH